jgi:hypothetical protein
MYPKTGAITIVFGLHAESGRVDSQLPPATGSLSWFSEMPEEGRVGFSQSWCGFILTFGQVESGKAVVAFEGAERAKL